MSCEQTVRGRGVISPSPRRGFVGVEARAMEGDVLEQRRVQVAQVDLLVLVVGSGGYRSARHRLPFN